MREFLLAYSNILQQKSHSGIELSGVVLDLS